MGLGGIGPASLLLILLIVILLFGTKRIRSIGSDLGAALKNFRKGVNDAEKSDEDAETTQQSQQHIEDASDSAGVEKTEEKK